jgi:hypothetical protein
MRLRGNLENVIKFVVVVVAVKSPVFPSGSRIRARLMSGRIFWTAIFTVCLNRSIKAVICGEFGKCPKNCGENALGGAELENLKNII